MGLLGDFFRDRLGLGTFALKAIKLQNINTILKDIIEKNFKQTLLFISTVKTHI